MNKRRSDVNTDDSKALARNTRNTSTGRFLPGNPGGPGRPRRAVEREYLATLSDAVSLDDWREIVQANVKKAKQGDASARDWLAGYLLGSDPLSLTRLAVREALNVTPDVEIDAEVEFELAPPGQMEQMLKVIGEDALTAWERALRLAGHK
jgi:hypothetical protein